MQIDPTLKHLAESGHWDEIEALYLQHAETEPHDVEYFADALQLLVRKGEEARATTLAQILLDLLRDGDDATAELAFAREGVRVWPQSPSLRPELLTTLRRAYPDCPSLERLALHFRLAETPDPIAALASVEAWLRFDVGRAVLMQGRGVGRVREINLALGKLRVDFAPDVRVSLRRDEADRLLQPLAPGHFLLEKMQRPEPLRELAASDPGALLAKVFASAGRGLTLAEIREQLAGLVAEDRFAAWWKRARADARLASSGGARPTFTWSATSADADAALVQAFESASGREQLELARRHADRSPALAARFARRVARIAREARAADPSLALEAALTLERLPAVPDTDAGVGAAELLALADPVPVVAGVSDRALRQRGLELLRAQRADWPQLYARLLRAEADTRTLAGLYDALAGQGAELRALAVDDVLGRPQAAPRFFVWLCRESGRRPEIEARGDWGLLRRLLDALTEEAFRSLRAPLRELFDPGGLGERLAARLPRDQAEQLLALLLRDLGLEAHRKDGLRHVVLARHPDLREAGEDILYTTAEALEGKRAEFEQITRVDIPRNAEEIRKAAAHGDLRENFEYKSARERHEMLSSRAKTLHEELRRVRVLDAAAVDTSRVRVGTRVALEPVAGGEPRRLTILGPWDSDPARGIVSYLAPAIEPLLGRAPGDRVRLQDADYVVGDIRAWRDG